MDAAYLAENSYEPDYTLRTSGTFSVPASTDVIVCLGWFPLHDGRPSFDRDTPIRASEYPMTSPDVSAPSVVISEIEYFGDAPTSGVHMTATTENGQYCGEWDISFVIGDGYRLCDYGRLLGRTDAGGSMLVTTDVDVPEGHARNRVLLDVSLLSCDGGCAGRTRTFDVPLSSFIRPTSICTGDTCGINAGESIGIARLVVTWPATTTGAGWVLGDWREGASGEPAADVPQLDTDAVAVVNPSPTIPRAFVASYAIEVDRPVTAHAEIFSFAPIDGICPRGGAPTTWDSSATAATTFTVRFDGLCAGWSYRVLLTLTDTAGGVSQWTVPGYEVLPSGGRWIDSMFTTPGVGVTVGVSDLRFTTGSPDRVVELRDIGVSVSNSDLGLNAVSPYQCWIGDVQDLHTSSRAVYVGEYVRVHVTARIRTATDPHPRPRGCRHPPKIARRVARGSPTGTPSRSSSSTGTSPTTSYWRTPR